MKINYADFLKIEYALWTLLENLHELKVIPRKKNRYGTVRYFNDNEIKLYIERIVKKIP